MTERWLPVVRYEDLYQISDRGRTKSLRTGKVLTGRAISGYLMVALYREGKREDIGAHILVLEAFVGPCPDGQEAFHENDVGWDNRLENLRWETHSENIKHSKTRRLTLRERLDMIRQGY